MFQTVGLLGGFQSRKLVFRLRLFQFEVICSLLGEGSSYGFTVEALEVCQYKIQGCGLGFQVRRSHWHSNASSNAEA